MTAMRHFIRFSSSIVLGLVLCVCLLPADPPPQKVALLVGINRYDKRGLDDLQYAERDVGELARLLRAQGYQVRLLTSSAKGDDRATLANVRSVLNALLKKVKKNDLVLVALAGHGQQVEVKGKAEAFFCPVDAVKDDSGTMLGLSELIETLDGKGGINLVLVDACRDDPSPDRSRGIDGNIATRLPANTALFLSCSARQRSFETEKAGGGHGVFFHFVLEGLRGGAANKKGEVTWDGLIPYVRGQFRDEFARLMPSLEARQRPHVLTNLSADDPVLTTTRREPPREIKLQLGGGMTLELVRIEAGEFQMGAPEDEKGAREDEKPHHKVKITKPFYLGKYEVTRGQFRAFVKDDEYETEAEQGDGANGWDASKKAFSKHRTFTWKKTGFFQTNEHPVVNVSWNDARAFCNWANRRCRDQLQQQLGQGVWKVHLPTEAQWEYACRAGSDTRFHFGNEAEGLARHGNGPDGTAKKQFPDWKGTITAEDGFVFTAPVGQFRANAWKLHDMHGNVWEWCRDYYDARFYAKSSTKDPLNTNKEGNRRVERGGSWFSNYTVNCRAAVRYADAPHDRYSDVGFRVALCLDGP